MALVPPNDECSLTIRDGRSRGHVTTRLARMARAFGTCHVHLVRASKHERDSTARTAPDIPGVAISGTDSFTHLCTQARRHFFTLARAHTGHFECSKSYRIKYTFLGGLQALNI